MVEREPYWQEARRLGQVELRGDACELWLRLHRARERDRGVPRVPAADTFRV